MRLFGRKQPTEERESLRTTFARKIDQMAGDPSQPAVPEFRQRRQPPRAMAAPRVEPARLAPVDHPKVIAFGQMVFGLEDRALSAEQALAAAEQTIAERDQLIAVLRGDVEDAKRAQHYAESRESDLEEEIRKKDDTIARQRAALNSINERSRLEGLSSAEARIHADTPHGRLNEELAAQARGLHPALADEAQPVRDPLAQLADELREELKEPVR